MVRAVAEQDPVGVRDFFVRFQDRIIFGSDLVVGDKYDWDHYASRIGALQKTWETQYRGESPIEDPDAGKGFDPKTGRFNEAAADGIPSSPASICRRKCSKKSTAKTPSASGPNNPSRGKTEPRLSGNDQASRGVFAGNKIPAPAYDGPFSSSCSRNVPARFPYLCTDEYGT